MGRRKRKSAESVSLEARAKELEEQIRKFDALTAAAIKTSQMSAAVSAAAKATELRRSLARLRSEIEAIAVDDPVLRLDRLQRAAAADGSWVAAAQLQRQLEEAKVKQKNSETLETNSMTDEQLLAIIVAAVAAMPPQHLERIEDAVELRRSGKVVRMSAPA
jgi:myosin heavy subunit